MRMRSTAAGLMRALRHNTGVEILSCRRVAVIRVSSAHAHSKPRIQETYLCTALLNEVYQEMPSFGFERWELDGACTVLAVRQIVRAPFWNFGSERRVPCWSS